LLGEFAHIGRRFEELHLVHGLSHPMVRSRLGSHSDTASVKWFRRPSFGPAKGSGRIKVICGGRMDGGRTRHYEELHKIQRFGAKLRRGAAQSSMSRPTHDILRESAIAVHATGERPVWVFEDDGSRLVFANPAGALLLGFPNCSSAAAAAVAPDLAARISRSAATLALNGQPRLERLRGLGAALGRPLTCACTRVKVGSSSGILVAAVEDAGPALTLHERARYLIEGNGAVAAFGADAVLLHATAEALRHIERTTSLRDLDDGIETLRVGDGANAAVLAFFPAESRPIKPRRNEAAAAAQPAPVDLSPIAGAITAMTKVPQQQNGTAQDDVPPPQSEAAANGNTDQTQRWHPLRFFWETDAENRFTINGEEFIALAGSRTTNLLGRFWGEISAKLALDPEGLVAHALVSRDTWSGIEVTWPTEDGHDVRVTLSGIPIFDRDTSFRGYRGLGAWHGTAETEYAEPELLQPAGHEPVASNDLAAERRIETQQPDDAATDVPPQSENVVRFRAANSDPKTPGLSAAERSAFHDLGSRLAARLKGADELARGLMEKSDPEDDPPPPNVPPLPVVTPQAPTHVRARALPELPPDDDEVALQRPVLDRLPLGVLIYRGATFIYANPAFLSFAGHASLADFAEAGGLDSMFVEFEGDADTGGGQRLRIAASGTGAAMKGHLVTAPVDGESAMVLMLQPGAAPPSPADIADGHSAEFLNLATDGVVTVSKDGTILTANARAERLFGYESGTLAGRPFGDLFAPESERVAKTRLDRVARDGAPDDDIREIIGRRRQGGLISLQLALGRTEISGTRICALFRDITRWKDAEKEMMTARQQAEKASFAKSEFLAKISHEMRTPLNAIIGFSDVMMEERFGPVGNERYRDYLKDINVSGAHLVSLLNDLLDLSKIEAGKMELSFERIHLNDVTQQCVAIMQAQANRARVIVRTALSMNIPGILADARSVRQIVLNLLSNSIKFTSDGGQVIVSTAATDRGDVVLRVRDTGVGMSEKDIEIALQPFRQLTAPSRTDANGTGLGLPLTKALAEANRARFSIKSAINAGTLVEIVFPVGRVLPE
jgi:PAS domain S-box-containing protein